MNLFYTCDNEIMQKDNFNICSTKVYCKVNMVTTGVRPVVKYRLQKKPLTTDNFTCL